MSRSSKRYRTLALHGLIITIVTLLLFEAAGVFFYYQKHGGLYYVETPRPDPLESRDAAAGSEFSSKTVLHPFLGFAFRSSLPMSRVAGAARQRTLLQGHGGEPSWTELETNNHGFFSSFDYPYKKNSPQDYIIGIFGGSVAQWFAMQGEERLKRELGELPALRDRNIIILNFSQGGFKQPQQVQALSYFLAIGQEFDLVVNIDGFNEIALTHINHKRNIGTSMPSAQHVLPVLALMGSADMRLEMLDRVHKLRQSGFRLERIDRWKSSTQSAGVFMVLSVLHDRYRNEYAAENQMIDSLGRSFDRTELVQLTTLPAGYDMSASLRDALQLWLDSAVTMQAISNAKGIHYLEVIQPNQYFSKKVFTARERRMAINENSPYREAVSAGYPYLASHALCLRQRGVNIMSAVDIFDRLGAQVYADSCCHYNQTGNDVLAGEVAKFVAALLAGEHIFGTGAVGQDAAPGCIQAMFDDSQ